MAASIPEQNSVFDFAGTTRPPERDRQMHQGVFDNSLIKMKENDFSSLLLRQLPNPVVDRSAHGASIDFKQSGLRQNHNQSAMLPDPVTPERRIDDRRDRQDPSAIRSEEDRRSGDNLPLDEPRQAREETVGRAKESEDSGASDAETHVMTAEEADTTTNESGLADTAKSSALPSDTDAADSIESTASAHDIPSEEALSGQEEADHSVDSSTPMAAIDSENLAGTGIRAEQEKSPTSAKTGGAADGQFPGNSALLASTDTAASEGEADESMPGFSRSILDNLRGAATESGEEGDPEVTKEFKELSKSVTLNQLAPTSSATLNATTQQEKSELQRLAILESGFKDKVAVTPPHASGMRTTAAMAPSSSPYVTNIPAQVQSPEWQQGVVKKLLWFVSEKIQSAQIHVNPPELGPVDMKIQVNKDQAQVQIQSPHAVVRDLLEGTAVRLREMLANQGIELSNFNVGSQQDHSNQQGDSRQSAGSAAAGSETSLETETTVAVQSGGVDQLVDYYV